MKKIIGVVKDFFADFKDFWFLLKPQFKYGGAYYTLSFILYEIGQVGNNILWVYFYKVILDMAVAGESFLSIMTVIALFLLGVVVVDLLRNSPLANFCPEWGAKINARISKNILIKALECDYKNFDDPEFYQNYTLTLTDYMGPKSESFFIFTADSSEYHHIFYNDCACFVRQPRDTCCYRCCSCCDQSLRKA